MRIGILKTDRAPEILLRVAGDYDAPFRVLLDGHGFDFTVFAVSGMEFPPGPEAAEGWLITGSVHGVDDDLPWIAPLERLIRGIHASGRPLIGVCFGHQIIAQALGGRVERSPAGWTVGVVDYEIEGQPVALNAWHQDEVTRPPGSARVLGRSATCAHAVLGYGDSIWTIQSHPEYTRDDMERLLRLFGPNSLPGPVLAAATASLARSTANDDIALHMAGFFKKERA